MTSPDITKQQRNARGSAITESAASFFLLFTALVGLVAGLSIATIYSAGWYLNYLETRQASLYSTTADSQKAIADTKRTWFNSAFAKFAGVRKIEDVTEAVNYTAPAGTTDGAVQVDTTVIGHLLLTGTPITTQFTGKALVEHSNVSQ